MLPAPTLLRWQRLPSGWLSASAAACAFEIIATETGFVLVATGAGTLKVETDTEAEAQHAALHLLRCWPRWTVQSPPVLDS